MAFQEEQNDFQQQQPASHPSSSYTRIQELEFESVKEDIEAENRSDNTSEEERDHNNLKQKMSFDHQNNDNEDIQYQ